MSKDNNTSYGGIGLTGLLTVLFVALKLTGVIAWKWIWVVSPIWISLVGGIAILVFVAFFGWLINKKW